MSIGDSLKKMIGIEELDDEITEEEIEAEKAKIAKKSGKREIETEKAAPLKSSERYASASSASSQISGKKERRFTVTSTSSFKMVLLEPKSFEECPRLVDSLKSKKPVIINLERIDMELARKIFDFLSGATYALNGNVEKVANNIFIFAPESVDIAGKITEDSVGYDIVEDPLKKSDSPWR